MPFKTKLGFGLGSFGLDISWQMTSLYLLYFLTDIFGLSAADAALVILIALIWDALSDPVMGVIASRMRSQLGGYSLWLLYGSLPYCFLFCLLFGLTELGISTGLAFALLLHTLYRTSHTAINVPYSALGARLSYAKSDRTNLAAYRVVFGMIGSLIAAILTLPIVRFFGQDNAGEGFLRTSMIFGVISFVALLLCYRIVSKVEISLSSDSTRKNSGPDIRSLVTNIALARLSIASIFFCAGFAYLSACLVYYFKIVFNNPDAVGSATGLIVVLIATSTPFWAKISLLKGRWFVWLNGTLTACLGLLLFFASYGQGQAVLLASLAVFGIGAGALPVMVWSYLPDIADRISSNEQQDVAGLSYSIIIFAQKIGLACGGAMVGVVLSLLGYDVDQDLEGKLIIHFHSISIALVLFLFLISLLMMWRYDKVLCSEGVSH